MKNGKFEVGDKVKVVVDCSQNTYKAGDEGVITEVCGEGHPNFHYNVYFSDDISWCYPNELVLVDSQFNLKTQPWVIRTETPEQRIDEEIRSILEQQKALAARLKKLEEQS